MDACGHLHGGSVFSPGGLGTGGSAPQGSRAPSLADKVVSEYACFRGCRGPEAERQRSLGRAELDGYKGHRVRAASPGVQGGRGRGRPSTMGSLRARVEPPDSMGNRVCLWALVMPRFLAIRRRSILPGPSRNASAWSPKGCRRGRGLLLACGPQPAAQEVCWCPWLWQRCAGVNSETSSCLTSCPVRHWWASQCSGRSFF